MAFRRRIGAPRIKVNIGQSIGKVRQNVSRKTRRTGFGFSRGSWRGKGKGKRTQQFGFGGL